MQNFKEKTLKNSDLKKKILQSKVLIKMGYKRNISNTSPTKKFKEYVNQNIISTTSNSSRMDFLKQELNNDPKLQSLVTEIKTPNLKTKRAILKSNEDNSGIKSIERESV